MRWTEGHLAASQRPWRRRPRRGRGHRLTKPEAVDVAPGVRRSEPQVLGWYRRAKATKRGGMGGEESECLIVPPKRGN